MALAAGAFAFGQNDKHGWSSGSAYNYKTPSEAQDAAMTRCRSRQEAGSYFKVIATINGRCFAIAVQESGNGYGWNTAATGPEAEKLAMDRCAGYGKSCSVRNSFCDTGDQLALHSAAGSRTACGRAGAIEQPARRRFARLPEISRSLLAHDPEKCGAVFRRDHAQNIQGEKDVKSP